MLKYLISATFVCAFFGLGFLWGVDVAQLLNFQSLLIVFGGLCMAIWLGFPAKRVRATFHSVFDSFSHKAKGADDMELLAQALGLARIYRMKGPLALQKAASKVKDDFLRYGVILVAEGYDELSLMSSLQREYMKRNDAARSQVQLIKTLARLAPALGMAGTVISLMQVMQELGTNQALGSSLGLALSSTLYGILLANLLFLPTALKLEQHFSKRAAAMRMAMDALLGMQKAEHPLRIAERLNSYELYCRLKDKEGSKSQVIRLKRQAVS